MPFLIGWLAGGMLLRSGLFRPVVTVLFWWGLTCVCFFIGSANVSREAGQALGLAVPTALLLWALWDPATSKVKFWLVEGLMICASLLFAILLLVIAVRFAMVGFRLRDFVSDWPLAVAAAVAWAVRKALFAVLDRSHRKAGDMSVVLE